MKRRSAGGAGHRLLVGSATQVADDFEDWFRGGTADGFTIMLGRHRRGLRELHALGARQLTTFD
ncbi:hypothetical protein ACFQ10_49385 [Streptomyces indonesiensis]